MENFVVSARKYRPSTFDSVIGQEHITGTLKNAIKNNQLAHAFLFCGPRGVGKTTCARILAKTINCLNITADAEACNNCDSCNTFNSNTSFNIYELDAASNNSVDDIRGLVDQVRYAPQGSKYKIYIIDEVHMLTTAAFNAFLKTLEEPPAYAKFILATTERHKILPTILSRCQVFDFHRINIESAVKQLKKIIAQEGIEAEEEALHVIAQKADGAMRDALSIFDRMVSFSGKRISYKDVIDNLNILDYDYYFKAVDYMLGKDLPSMLLLFDEILSKGFDPQHFLSGFSEHLRNLMMCKYPNTHKLLEVAQNVAAKFIQQSQAASNSLLLNALNIITKCELEYKSAKNPRLHVELMLMKLCHIQSVIDLHQLSGSDTKKKTIDLTEQPKLKPTIDGSNDAKEVTTPVFVSKSFGIGNSQKKLEKLREQIVTVTETQVEEAVEPVYHPSEVPEPSKQLLALEQVQAVWQQYGQQLAQTNKVSLAVIYKNAIVALIDSQTILATLGSQHEKEMLEDDRINSIPYLRSILKHSEVEISYKVEVNHQPAKAFTPTEKFEAMVQKNPLLIELRNTLGLEIE
jgi:DNA polymerase III subunit gamma/tau